SYELAHFDFATRPLLALYGDTLAREFGPRALQTLRQQMIDGKRYRVRFQRGAGCREKWVPEGSVRVAEGVAELEGEWRPVEVVKSERALSRNVVNQRIDHIKRLLKWAVAEELVPPAVYQGLQAVRGLQKGRSDARETEKVKPVRDEWVQ